MMKFTRVSSFYTKKFVVSIQVIIVSNAKSIKLLSVFEIMHIKCTRDTLHTLQTCRSLLGRSISYSRGTRVQA